MISNIPVIISKPKNIPSPVSPLLNSAFVITNAEKKIARQ
jgi:hypothetical protein